jgi:hypothetical protein
MPADPDRKPSNDPKPYPTQPVQAPTTPGLPEREGDPEPPEEVVDRLALKA